MKNEKNRERMRFLYNQRKAKGICVDCGSNPKDGEGSVLCVDCKSDRKVRAKMVRGENVKKYRKLTTNTKPLTLLVQEEAHEKLLAMVGGRNKSCFMERLILREHARLLKRAEEKQAQKDALLCTDTCATLNAVSHSA